ncbi:FAD-dependent oxidoreductase [Oculatella sp. LEGE 06141]|uniref:FAD-dependent oxidoreductase n=1 Tax=Oculatella sp. LEGE 06141 TaxID=1828648 RepID=UPI001880E3ED|nr:FAD-dependent oxidoreductase [Oculatella sp. LEGE 06141]MBE9180475.1 FAD-dependent oxidoreductase [Oculatella sp. LEGE 06141]
MKCWHNRPGKASVLWTGGKTLGNAVLGWVFLSSAVAPAWAAPPRSPDQNVTCEVLVIGGGLAGAATAYESLLAGRTVCLTEITDWVGGQISAQGTSALDERQTQRSLLFYSRGYLELRDRIRRFYRRLNPGDCWVSESCFLPRDAADILQEMLEDAADRGNGELRWFPSTVVKELEIQDAQIRSVTAIQHRPAAGAPPLNTTPLSQNIEDWYTYDDSSNFEKDIIRFVPLPTNDDTPRPADWYVVEATETGEIIALADVPYRLGIDPVSYVEPSASSPTNDTYCTQGYTYTFAMQATEESQEHVAPAFYDRYQPYYSFELPRFDFDSVFTYRRIYAEDPQPQGTGRSYPDYEWTPGDISMQNWTWGNDYRPGTPLDNLIYNREQLQQAGQLDAGGWMGGLRTESLASAEELSIGYFHWLVAGTTDSQLGDGVKEPNPNHRYLSGLDSPMGTVHGLSKYPYMREGRRLIGRESYAFPQGFSIWEIDISRRDYQDEYYQEALPPQMYRSLRTALAGLETASAIRSNQPPNEIARRTRSTIYPDTVGIGHYAIDFHPCMVLSPPELEGNYERPGERRGAGQAYPFQIPLRSMIPQQVDNLLVAGKSIATSHIAAAAYRVHSFEWSSGAAAGTTVDFALDQNVLPYQLVDQLPQREPQLEALQRRLEQNNNPIAFPNTSIFNEDWQGWQ